MKLKVEGEGEIFFIEETLDDASGKATLAADEDDWDISFEIKALGKMWIDGGRLCSRKTPWWDAIGAQKGPEINFHRKFSEEMPLVLIDGRRLV